ncbi:uncharacterized protein LOC124809215 isoform X1 [Hydra vulgaris]|uniref:uncharacterized protein LOC124809215 isoform X1 n=1 Tax=Hydra vulgaris TaxID=6087 RepID=UPI001F5F42E2|nr:uncharacterized protein LOC124809215 [Hydra vulgaris]
MAKLLLKLVDIESKLVWLYIKKTKCEIEIIKVNDDSHQDSLPVLNIFPYLIDGEIEVWGVQPVLSYLVEKYGYSDLYNSEMKIKLNTTLSWISSTLCRYVLLSYVFPQSKDDFKLENGNGSLIAYGLQKINDLLHLLEEGFFTTNCSMLETQVTICDYYLALVLMELIQYNFDFSKYPKLNIWNERFFTEIRSIMF